MGFQQLRVLKYICVMFECVWDKKERKKCGWVESCGKSKVLLWKCKKIRNWRYWNRKHTKMCFQSLRRMNLWEVTYFAFSECVMTKCPLTPVFVWSVLYLALEVFPPWMNPLSSVTCPSLFEDKLQWVAAISHQRNNHRTQTKRQMWLKHCAANGSIRSLYWVL